MNSRSNNMSDAEVKKLQSLIDNATNIVFFGGAGVSTESGIKDFRSKDGLYELESKYGVPYETILSHTYYRYHTDTFFEFYREFMIVTTAKPNPAHLYLAELEKKKNLTIITQNIDGLHQKAGSKKVLELHGSIERNYCERCGKFYSLSDILQQSGTPRCTDCGAVIKPDVVLYEEKLNGETIDSAIRAMQKADLLIIAGTSLAVYPAAAFIDYYNGTDIVVINKTHVPVRRNITLEINEPVGEIFSKLK